MFGDERVTEAVLLRDANIRACRRLRSAPRGGGGRGYGGRGGVSFVIVHILFVFPLFLPLFYLWLFWGEGEEGAQL